MHQDFPDDDDYFDDDYFGRRDNPEDPYGIDPSDRATIGEDANDATPVAFPFLRDDFRARANRCFYGYEVSNPPLPLSPPPLADLELTPRVVEDLIARLDADAEPAYVTVTATGRSNGAAPPFYRARVYGRWPRGPRGASSVCEIALGLDDWLEDEPTPTLTPRERRIDIDVSSAIETSSSSSIIDSDGERRIAPMSSSPGRRRIRGVEDILALCASLKRGVPIYVARDVVDRFSVHPLGWRSSFHPSRADLERVDRDRRRRRSVDDASAGSAYRLHTPRNSDPDDPDLFDAFARFFVNERNRPGSTTVVAYGEHARGNLRAGGYAPRDGAGGVTRVARMLLLGPVAFFCLVVHAWTEWRRRWHGFPRRPSLAAQTGKHGNLARAAHRRATLRRRRASSTRLRRQSETFARRRFSRRENTKRRRRGAESRGSRPRRRPRRSLPRRRPGREPIDPFHASPNRDRGEGTAGRTLAIRLAFGLGSHRSGNRRAELHSGGASRGDDPVRRVGRARTCGGGGTVGGRGDVTGRAPRHEREERRPSIGVSRRRNRRRPRGSRRSETNPAMRRENETVPARTREEAELSLSSLFSTCRPLPGMYHVLSKVTGDTWNWKIVRSPSTSGRCCRGPQDGGSSTRRESAYERFPRDPSTTTSTSIW